MNEFRSIDGSNNNGTKGKANTQLIRLFDPAFEDGIGTPRGGEISTLDPVTHSFVDASTLPNPRTISNLVIDEVMPTTNFLNASDWLWQWGQLIDHDLALNEGNAERPLPGEFSPIIVEDPTDPTGPFLPFVRVSAFEGTGETTPRQIENNITAFIDGSMVYGSTEERAAFLRSDDVGRGFLKTTRSDNGETILPQNPTDNPLPNATGGVLGNIQFVAGDVRANEQVGLTAAHALLVREHNRIASGLYERLEAGEAALIQQFENFQAAVLRQTPSAAPERIQDNFLYESARKVIGAKIQVITYEEFLPLLIGDNLEEYRGFRANVDPQVSVEFANAAFRLGHTMLSNQLRRVDSEGVSEISLSDAFFSPGDIQSKGVDNLLAGLSFQGAQAVDHQLVDSVRDFLFPAGTGGLDLGAVNIARGRDTGIISYTEAVAVLGGPAITSFVELRRSGRFKRAVVDLFESVYESVEQIDLWLGGIAERPDAEHGGLLGPTLSSFIAEQFARTRDGDEFFYLNDAEQLNILSPDIEETTLSQLIRDNVSNPYVVPDDAFTVPVNRLISGDGRNNNLFGTARGDLIEGEAGRDRLSGRGGDDLLFGGKSKDRLNGQAGNDYLDGGDGNDILNGGNGDDIINGGRGGDQLRGGRGRDTFFFGSDLLDGRRDVDKVSGFETIDSIDLGGYISAGGSVSVQQLTLHRLAIDLSGEDTIYVAGRRSAISAAIAQINAFTDVL